jgi:hypothetical protein
MAEGDRDPVIGGSLELEKLRQTKSALHEAFCVIVVLWNLIPQAAFMVPT